MNRRKISAGKKAKSTPQNLAEDTMNESNFGCDEDAKDRRIAKLEAENTHLKCYIADTIVLHKFICDSSDD